MTDAQMEEIRRHFDVVAESIRSESHDEVRGHQSDVPRRHPRGSEVGALAGLVKTHWDSGSLTELPVVGRRCWGRYGAPSGPAP